MIFGKCTQQVMSAPDTCEKPRFKKLRYECTWHSWKTQIWKIQKHVWQTISTDGDEGP